MTTPTLPPVSAVAAMSGRGLDACLQKFFYGWQEVEEHPIGWLYRDHSHQGFVSGNWHSVPLHSSSEGQPFFMLLRAVEEAGWVVCIRSGLGWCSVELSKYDERGIRIGHIQPPREATLPLAMARAVLMTCYPGGPSS